MGKNIAKKNENKLLAYLKKTVKVDIKPSHIKAQKPR